MDLDHFSAGPFIYMFSNMREWFIFYASRCLMTLKKQKFYRERNSKLRIWSFIRYSRHARYITATCNKPIYYSRFALTARPANDNYHPEIFWFIADSSWS